MKDKMQKPITDIDKQRDKERIRALLALSADQSAKATACPDAEKLAALAENTVDEQQRDELLGHLVVCPDCYEIWLGIANPEQAEEKTGQVIQGPWYAQMAHYMREQKAATAAFAATACLVLFFGVRLTTSPISTETSPSAAIVFQTADINHALAFLSGYEQTIVPVPRTRGGETKGSTPEESFRNQNVIFGHWLKKLSKECLAGKETTRISTNQTAQFLELLDNAVQKEDAWSRSASNFLQGLHPLVTHPGNTIHCAQLLPVIDEFLTATTKQLPQDRTSK